MVTPVTDGKDWWQVSKNTVESFQAHRHIGAHLPSCEGSRSKNKVDWQRGDCVPKSLVLLLLNLQGKSCRTCARCHLFGGIDCNTTSDNATHDIHMTNTVHTTTTTITGSGGHSANWQSRSYTPFSALTSSPSKKVTVFFLLTGDRRVSGDLVPSLRVLECVHRRPAHHRRRRTFIITSFSRKVWFQKRMRRKSELIFQKDIVAVMMLVMMMMTTTTTTTLQPHVWRQPF